MTAEKRALVLSGGGAYAAYEVGVIKALAAGLSPATEHRPLLPAIVTGTSSGAFNAAFLVAGRRSPGEVAKDLESTWLEVIADQGDGHGNGVFRYRADPLELLRFALLAGDPLRALERLFADFSALLDVGLRVAGWIVSQHEASVPQRLIEAIDLTAFISTGAFLRTLHKTIDFEVFRHAGTALRIAVTDWTTGASRIVDNLDMTPEQGPAFIRASASLPGIFPPVPFGGTLLVDGGVSMNTPLDPAVQAGATELYVVEILPFHGFPSETMSSVNALLCSEGMTFHSLVRNEIEAYRTLGHTVHRFSPRSDLSSNPLALLSFDRDRIREYIERGFHDAIEHDCAVLGCHGRRAPETGLKEERRR